MSHIDELGDDAGDWRSSPWLEWGMVGLIAVVYAVIVWGVLKSRGQ